MKNLKFSHPHNVKFKLCSFFGKNICIISMMEFRLLSAVNLHIYITFYVKCGVEVYLLNVWRFGNNLRLNSMNEKQF